MALATLSIDIVASLAKFEGEMRRATGIVEKSVAGMKGSFAGLGTVFAGNVLASGVTELARSLVSLVPDLVKTAANFQDLEEKTGASAGALASMQTAADVAGISTDQLAGYMVKLTGTLSKTNDETKGAGGALKALGLDIQTFRQLAPEEQFQKIAERLALFKDGAGKTAVAVALLGKSGAEALPFFKELAENGPKQFLTPEQIKLADAYADAQARVRSELKQMAQVAAVSAIPTIIALQEASVDAARELLGLNDSAGQLDPNRVGSFAREAALSLAALIDVAEKGAQALKLVGTAIGASLAQGAAVARGDIKGAIAITREGLADLKKQGDAIVNGPSFSDRLKAKFDKNDAQARVALDPEVQRQAARARAAKPQLNFVNTEEDSGKGGRAAAAAAKAALREAEQVREAELNRSLKASQDRQQLERDAVSNQQSYLKAQYDAGLSSLQDYYGQREILGQQALDADLERYARDRAALQASLEQTTDRSKRVDLVTKIADVEADADRARRQYAAQSKLDLLAQGEGYKQLTDKVQEFAAQLLQLQGDDAGAAQIRTAQAIDNARRLRNESQGRGTVDVQGYEDALRRSNQLAESQKRLGEITSRSANQEERYLIAAEQRGAGMIETEKGIYAIRSTALAQLGELLAKTEALAAGAGPDSPVVKFAESLRLEFDRLAASVDPALERLRGAQRDVADALGNAAEQAILNFGDLRSVIKGLGQDLLRISTKTLVTDPLKKELEGALRGLTEGKGFLAQGAAKIFNLNAKPGAAPVAGVATADTKENASLRALFKDEPTEKLSAGLQALQATGVQPATDALGRFVIAIDQAAGSVGSIGGLKAANAPVFGDTTGVNFGNEGRRAANDASAQTQEASAALSESLIDTRTNAQAVADLFKDMPIVLGNFGQGANAAALALRLLPSIISALSTPTNSSTTSGGSLVSLFSGLFGGSGGGADAAIDISAGYARGGYTGDKGVAEVAGVVHGKEFVFSASATQLIGVEKLDRMHRDAKAGRMPGYAEGGFVGRRGSPTAPRFMAGASAVRGDTNIDMRGLTVNSNGYMDRMEEDRAAARIARKAQSYLGRRSA